MVLNPDLAEDFPTPDADIEIVESEQLDMDAPLATYEILTYPADFTLEVLVNKWRQQQIIIPDFQRRFVWNQIQASKLIESFLLGLPVPAIFLYSEPITNDMLVVDGQQRLKTIAYFFEGFFGEESSGSRSVFRLTGLDDSSPFSGKTYKELQDLLSPWWNKLNDSVLRAFVIKQLDPADDTSIYHIFERLNTGGTFLNPQEIRNCIHHGPFNDELLRLNELPVWRKVFGHQPTDKRQRDVELILRFLALRDVTATYEKPMKDFLNKYMKAHRHPSDDWLADVRTLFASTTHAVHQSLGDKPFHIRAGLNAAVFDAVFVAFSRHLDQIPTDISERFSRLQVDNTFLSWARSGTTDKDVVQRRIAYADQALFG